VALKSVERSGRIAAWTAPDELNDLLKLTGFELGYDLVDTLLMKQVNSRYYRLRHPSHPGTVKCGSENISHGRSIPCRRSARIRSGSKTGQYCRRSSQL